MERKRPQLSLDELHQLRWLLGSVLILISVWTVFYLEIDAWVLTGIATAAVLAVLGRPDLPARLPVLAHKLAFPFIVAFFAWDLYSTAEVLPAAIRLDLLLLLYRGVSYRRKRDDLQVIVLGLILVMMAGVLTVSLAFAVQILVFTACTLAFLFVLTLTEAARARPEADAGSADRGHARVPPWATVSWGRLARRLREVTDWRLLALGGALFVGVVAVSALLFLVIPRFQLENSFFLDRFITKKSRTGFSDSIRFGDVIDIQQDNSVALRVDVSDPARVPVTPYWRMVVLDEYRAGVLRTSRRLQNEMELKTQMTPYVTGQLPPVRGAPLYWTFYFEAGISRHLPITGPFYLMRFREPQWVQQQVSLRMTALRNEPVTMTAYRVEGMRTDGFVPDRQFGMTLRNAQRAQAEGNAVSTESDEHGQPRIVYPLTTLQLPGRTDDQQALQQMAAGITGAATLAAEEFAARASRWLTDRHGYSLQVGLPGGGRDPVVMWAESRLPGNCELFTAAFTLLARAAGFPTRVITGFRGGDWNAYENYFMVRNAHAHAWCEVYDGSTGWLRVDPTAGAAAVAAREQGQPGQAALTRRLDRSWQARFDAIRILWYRRIVSFDQRSQLALLVSLKETTGSIGAAMQAVLDGAFASVRRWLQRPWDGRRVADWLGAGLLAAGAVLLWWRHGRAWWWNVRSVRRHGGVDPVRREAGRWLRRLFEGRRVSGERREVLAELQRLRYGPRATWPEPQAVFRRARRTLHAERHAVSPR
jgi:transglutaminase-like putative cysteine protease